MSSSLDPTDDSDAVGDSLDSIGQSSSLPASRWRRVLTVVLLIALVLGLAGLVAIALFPPETTDPYTEFYILGPSGNATDYPTTLAPGESGDVIVGITNHEHREVTYRVSVSWNGTETIERNVTVGDEANREFPVTITAPEESREYRVYFSLYGGSSGEEPMRNRLLVSVLEE